MFKRVLVLCMVGLWGCGGAAAPKGRSAVPPADPTEGGTASEVAAEPGSLAAVVASAERSPDNRARDRYRHPLETLTFFGIEPDMHVLEIRPGGGWYTEILALYLAESGDCRSASPARKGRAPSTGSASWTRGRLDPRSSEPQSS